MIASGKTTFFVGLFVIIGLAIAISAIVWLGMSNYFEKGKTYLAYFDESVQGLDRDSPVKYRGVSIGRVNNIRVAPDGTLIEVELVIEDTMKIEPDMVGQLKSVGITGIMFIEIDRRKPGEPDYSPKLDFSVDKPIIATRPSGMKQFIDGMERVMDHIYALDSKGISDRVKVTVDNINKAFEDAQIRELSTDIRATLADIQQILDAKKVGAILTSIHNAGIALNGLIHHADKVVANVDQDINRLLASADRAVMEVETLIQSNQGTIHSSVAGLKQSVDRLDTILTRASSVILHTDQRMATLVNQFQATLEHIENASENLDLFMDTIATHPSQLVFGQPPEPRAYEQPNDMDH